MIIREDAIYGRQSVDRKDSISIESQIEFCKYELRGGNFRKYTDKGYSGKNTDRPKFQEMMADIRRGLIKRVVVYKLDRISRSILDFATMMETFQEYNVEFVSSTEKFDTSTPMGRAMLNICIVFAQLERETIQKRVTDAYYSRCQHGFHMSGAAPYGFQLEPTTIEGIRTKMMKPDPETADIAKLMFEMYSQPGISFGDIARYFADEGILIYGKEMKRGFISQLLRNPIYAQADLDMYEFFKSQGTVVVNEATDFAGTNGCYLYQGRDVQERKNKHLKDQILVLAPSEGLVSSDTWLRCRKKLMANKTFQGGRKAKNTWLAGKIKCGRCGYALTSEDEWIIAKNTHDPIISDELFEKVQQINKEAVERTKANSGKYDHLPKAVNIYGKKFVCADCGAVMKLTRSISTKKDKAYFTFKCPTYAEHGARGCSDIKMRKGDLDEAVFAFIKAQMDVFLDMESTIRRLLAMKKSKLKQNNTVQEIRALKQKLAHKQSLLSGMYVDLKEGLLSQEEYGHHREIIGEDIRALELKLSELESAKMETEEQITGEMKWKFMIQRYYDATEISADMADAFIESMKLHADGSLEIKLSYMDEFEALTSTCERLRKEVA